MVHIHRTSTSSPCWMPASLRTSGLWKFLSHNNVSQRPRRRDSPKAMQSESVSGNFNAHLKTVRRYPTSPWYIAFVLVQYTLLVVCGFYAFFSPKSEGGSSTKLHPLEKARHPDSLGAHHLPAAIHHPGLTASRKHGPSGSAHKSHALHQKRAVSSQHGTHEAHTPRQAHAKELQLAQAPARRKLPDHVVMCYASWSECDEQVLQGVRNGCNVLVWFALQIHVDVLGSPVLVGGPDRQCVAKMARQMHDEGWDVLHLVSFGGWAQAHPSDAILADQAWAAWKNWDREGLAYGFRGFDGVDWDIEGVDDVASADNVMSLKLLDMIGQFSQLAKAEGYITSLAPMQSYLDPTTSDFSRALTFEDPDYHHILPAPFKYHGHNCYAYLLAKYGSSTYDLIFVQLYESYSKAAYAIETRHKDAAAYLAHLLDLYSQGWLVNFDQDPTVGIHSQIVTVSPHQLVFGTANAWGGRGDPVKALYLDQAQLSQAWARMTKLGLAPRGFGFWSLADEGKPERGDGPPVFLAQELSKIVNLQLPVGGEEEGRTPLQVVGLKQRAVPLRSAAIST